MVLSITNLHVEYGRSPTAVPVVRDVTLELPEGSALALVGESGSGKSTLALSVMRMIDSNIGRVSSGEIRLAGQNLLALSRSEMRRVLRNDIGFIPQDPTTALDPLFTVRRQIAEVLPRMKRSETSAEVVRLLEVLGVPDAAQRMMSYPHEFSGGMRQRVATAIALAKDPKLLIADEPTTALDVTTQLSFLRLLGSLRRDRGLTTLFITHNLRVAQLLCDDVAVMYAGKIVEYGPLRTVMANPVHPYTKALKAATNIGETPRVRLQTIPGQPPQPSDVAACAFAPRCPRATSICRESAPSVAPTRSGSLAACWNPDE